jgi:molecular chaperone IbpA
MTSIFDVFNDMNKLNRFLVGGDQYLKQVQTLAEDAASSINANWPPYNVKKVAENTYVIEMAVAGFGKQDIELEMVDGKLIIKGKLETVDDLTKDGVNQTYLYKGIAERAFTRQFTIADNVEINNAELINGMLKVWLEAIIPEHKKPKKININTETDKESVSKDKQFLAE